MPLPSVTIPITVRATATGDTVVIADPGAGHSITVLKGSVHNRGTAVSPVLFLHAGGLPARWTARVSANGGSASFDFGDGWKLAQNQPLNVNLAAAGDVDVNVTDYFVDVN